MSEAPERIWLLWRETGLIKGRVTCSEQDHTDEGFPEYVRADRIEELEAKLAACEKYRDAYAECDRIGTQSVRELEAKLAKMAGIGNKMAKSIEGNYYLPGVAGEWRKLTGGKDE